MKKNLRLMGIFFALLGAAAAGCGGDEATSSASAGSAGDSGSAGAGAAAGSGGASAGSSGSGGAGGTTAGSSGSGGSVGGAAGSGSCTSYMGQATAAEIAKSPYANAEAEVLAIEGSGKLVAPEHVYQRIVLDLSTIRGQNPEVQNIKAMVSWLPDGLLMGFDAEGMSAVEDGTYSDWDCANALYGFKGKDVTSFVNLHFSHKFNAPLLAKEYGAFSHVEYAEPNGIAGDGNDVCVSIEGDTTFHYIFDAGSGDCPAGCIDHTYWGFTSKGSPATITMLGKFSKNQGNPPAWFVALPECTKWL